MASQPITMHRRACALPICLSCSFPTNRQPAGGGITRDDWILKIAHALGLLAAGFIWGIGFVGALYLLKGIIQ